MSPDSREKGCGGPSSGATVSSLSKLLEDLGRIEPSDQEKELSRAIIAGPPADQPFGFGNDDIERFVGSWTKALRRSVTLLEPPSVRVLCAFGSVADTIYRLDQEGAEFATFLKWAAERLELEKIDDLIDRSLAMADDTGLMDSLTKGDGKAHDLREVVALLFWCIQHNKGKKPVLQTPEVQRQMLEYVRWRRQEPDPGVMTDSLGGASGNMCYVLRHLGLDVVAHWPYHHESIADGTPHCLRRLILNPAGGEEVPAGRKGFYFDDENRQHDDPVRRSVSFEFPAGMTMPGSGTGIPEPPKTVATAERPNRVIYQVPVYRSQSRPWKEIVLRLPASEGAEDLTLRREDVREYLDADGWPFLPLFAYWRVDGEKLIIEVADDHVMGQIAGQIDYFILAGTHALGWSVMKTALYRGDMKGALLRSVVKHHLIRQLQVLANQGVIIHTEIPAMDPGVFDDVGEVIRGRVRSVGLNDDDLLQVTGKDEHRGTRFFYASLNRDERDSTTRYRTVFRRSERTEHLARELGVDQVYVHGNDVDLIRRRRVSRGAVWREMEANLLAKAAVVLALMQRVKQPGAAAPLSPILTREGMLAFIQFAIDFAQQRHPRDIGKQRLLFKEILASKVVFERSGDDYSTLVTPVFWPDEPPEVTAGAGDMTSSVVAIFSGN